MDGLKCPSCLSALTVSAEEVAAGPTECPTCLASLSAREVHFGDAAFRASSHLALVEREQPPPAAVTEAPVAGGIELKIGGWVPAGGDRTKAIALIIAGSVGLALFIAVAIDGLVFLASLSIAAIIFLGRGVQMLRENPPGHWAGERIWLDEEALNLESVGPLLTPPIRMARSEVLRVAVEAEEGPVRVVARCRSRPPVILASSLSLEAAHWVARRLRAAVRSAP